MPRQEIITSVERRRRWSIADKQSIVAESAKPGRTVSQVARLFGIAPSQLFTWRREFLAAATGPIDDGFVAVEVAKVPPSGCQPSGLVAGSTSHIEIALPNGVRIRVDREVEVEPLRRVLVALAG